MVVGAADSRPRSMCRSGAAVGHVAARPPTSSPTVTKVSQTRAPTTWRCTQSGALDFWITDATSVSMTTSTTTSVERRSARRTEVGKESGKLLVRVPDVRCELTQTADFRCPLKTRQVIDRQRLRPRHHVVLALLAHVTQRTHLIDRRTTPSWTRTGATSCISPPHDPSGWTESSNGAFITLAIGPVRRMRSPALRPGRLAPGTRQGSIAAASSSPEPFSPSR